MSQKKRSTPKLLLVCLAIVGIATLFIPFFLTPPAVLTIRLGDKVFQSDLTKRKTATLVREGTSVSVQCPIVSAEGAYVVKSGRTASGPGTWTVSVEGYQSVTFQADIPPLAGMYDEPCIQEIKLEPNFGKISVRAKNAKSPDEAIRTAITVEVSGQGSSGSAAGFVALAELPPGQHKAVVVKAEGFCPTEKMVEVTAGKITPVEFLLSPSLAPNEVARVILTWGEHPKDLDSHLYLPEHEKLDNNHVYFAGKKSQADGALAAVLDVDDTTSFGPETTTIYNELEGKYIFGVYHFSGEGSIGSSGARVEVVTRGCQHHEFQAPTNLQAKWWYVCDIDTTGPEMKVIEKREAHTQEEWAQITGVKSSGRRTKK